MNSSDQDIGLTEQDQFSTYFPTKSTKKQLPNLHKIDEIADQCWKIHKNIIEKTKENVAISIVKLINENFERSSKRQDSQINPEINNLKRPQKLIMPICIRKSQTEYVKQFITALNEKIIQLFQTNQDDEQDLSGEEKAAKNKKKTKKIKTREQFQNISKTRKINIFFNQAKQMDKVQKIALYIHQRLKQIHLAQDMTLFLTDVVVKLKPQNLYIFQEGLAQCNCLIIAPTYQSFQEASYSKFSCMEIIPIKLFQHKQLFCQFMYECICSPQIKAYLPKQSLKLIDDFDDFPITFVEGSRRLIHCIQTLQILKMRKNITFRQVDIKTLFDLIEKSLKKIFFIFPHSHTTLKKYIKCILDEDQAFNLLDKYLNKAHYFSKHQQQQLTQNDLVINLRQKLVGYIQKQKSIKQYAKFFKQPLQKIKKGRSKNKQMIRFDIKQQNYMDEKNILQTQIRLVITNLANEIRKQAKHFQWSDFHFIQQIKPMFPYQVFKSVKFSPIHHELISFIYQKISTPLVRIIYKFCQEDQMDYGELMYYMKDLQVHGLIDISQNALNPMVTPAYFEKASYKARSAG